MTTRKEHHALMMERDRLSDAIKNLEEKYKSGEVSKGDYQLLCDRYERKLKEVEQELGLEKKEKKPQKSKLRFWRKKSS